MSKATALVLGNCQARSLADALERRSDVAVAFHRIGSASALDFDVDAVLRSSHGEAPEAFRTLAQSQLPALPRECPQWILLSLYHEARPLWRHRGSGALLYPDEEIFPGVENAFWRENFEMHDIDPMGYPGRFAALVERLQARYPRARLVVCRRASEWPQHGPNPYSYLLDWDAVAPVMDETLARMGVETVSLDDAAAHVERADGTGMGAVFPYMRHSSYGRRKPFPPGLDVCESTPSREYYRIRLARDIEHASDAVWDAVAKSVVEEQSLPVAKPIADAAWTPPRPGREALLARKSEVGAWAGLFEYLLWLMPDREPQLLNRSLGSHLGLADPFLLRMIALLATFRPMRTLWKFLGEHRAVVSETADSAYLAKLDRCIERLGARFDKAA